MKKNSSSTVTLEKSHKQTWIGRFLIDLWQADPAEVFMTLILAGFASALLYVSARVFLADSKVDYCTMESKLNYTTSGLEQTWFVTGHADWRGSNLIAATPSIEMAFALMQSPACKE